MYMYIIISQLTLITTMFLIDMSEKIESTTLVNDKGEFSIKSQSHQTSSYRVFFGDEDNIPFCTCPDWRKTILPCKHYLAIFQYFQKWTWNSLSKNYRESPLFNIDESVCFIHQQPEDTPSGSKSQEPHNRTPTPEDETDDVNEQSKVPPTQMFQSTAAALHSASICRELLRQLETMTYLCCDEKALGKMQHDLQNTIKNWRPHLPSEKWPFYGDKKAQKVFGS